jgi:hypothetical protein
MAQYDRLSEDGAGPSVGETPAPVASSTYPPSPRRSFESDGSGSDLVYRDIADEDPFDTEKQGFTRTYEEEEDFGYPMEPRRVNTEV